MQDPRRETALCGGVYRAKSDLGQRRVGGRTCVQTDRATPAHTGRMQGRPGLSPAVGCCQEVLTEGYRMRNESKGDPLKNT